MMPPHIRATFMPPPPLKSIPPIKFRRKNPVTGVLSFIDKFEKGPPPPRTVKPTPKSRREERRKKRQHGGRGPEGLGDSLKSTNEIAA